MTEPLRVALARMSGALVAPPRGGYHVAHAFTAQDAAAALPGACLSDASVIFSPREPLTRANVADRRCAVFAPDGEIGASLRRWLAVEPRVLDPDDAAAHVALYRELARR